MKPTVIQLKSGRHLEYTEYGQPDGIPLMLFHGTPGSCIQHEGIVGSSVKAGLRIIAPGRPGYGHSDPNPGYTVFDYSDDIIELADQLSLDRFGVMGISGGGPYVLACSSRIPDRLLSAGLVSSVAPPADPAPSYEAIQAQHQPLVQRALSEPDHLVDEMIANAPDNGRAVLAQPHVRAWMLATFTEAFRQGGQGFFDDIAAIWMRPWGFALDSIRVQVHLWHGTEDNPAASADVLAKSISDCVVTYLPGMDHFLPDEVFDDIYMTLRTVMAST